MITDTKNPNQPRFYGKTAQAVKLITEYGVDEKTALTLSGCKTLQHRGNLSKFRQKVSKYALSAPRMEKKAYALLNKVLDMQPVEVKQERFSQKTGEVVEFTEKIVPSFTNGLAAAAMVFDRSQPLKHINVNINADVDPFQLDDLQA